MSVFKEITSEKNQLIKDLSKLNQKKYRQKENQFLVEGKHLIEEAYLAGYLNMVLFVDDCPIKDIDAYKVTSQIIEKLSEVETHQGLIGVCQMPDQHRQSDRVLLLDGIQDPGNMGTLLRSSVAFGFKTIVIDHCVDVFNPKVIRSTQGAIFKLNMIHQDVLEYMKENQDITYIATDLNATKHLVDVSLKDDKIGLILGNEGSGIRLEVSERANIKVKIKMEDTESLNVAIAGSICMYELGGK